MASNGQSDVTVKHYARGNLAGKIALFFNTDKAKKVYSKITENKDTNYVLAYNADALPKAESFCTDWQLHYELIQL